MPAQSQRGSEDDRAEPTENNHDRPAQSESGAARRAELELGPPPPATPPSGVVGIGASAGGLRPLGELLDSMPPDSDLSFVVIQHLSPDSPSLLPELLRRHTTMEVRPAEEDLPAARNVVTVSLILPRLA